MSFLKLLKSLINQFIIKHTRPLYVIKKVKKTGKHSMQSDTIACLKKVQLKILDLSALQKKFCIKSLGQDTNCPQKIGDIIKTNNQIKKKFADV